MITKKDRRQVACMMRAKTARFYARLLMPVTALTFSAAMWSDPAAQSQIQTTLNDFKPMIEAAMDGRPVDEIIAAGQKSQFEQALAAQAVSTEDSIQEQSRGLPASHVPINRPDQQVATN